MKFFSAVIIFCFSPFLIFASMNNKQNPLLMPFDTPHQTAPFDKIKPEHFEPAFNVKIAESQKKLKKLLASKENPTFQNTIIPLELASNELSGLGSILFNLNSAETNTELQAVTQKISPKLTSFLGKVMLNKKLFEKVQKIYDNRFNSGLTQEEIRLVEITYDEMKRNGAALNTAKKIQLILIQMKLSKLNLKFKENVLNETNSYTLHISDKSDLSGLPESIIESAAMNAKIKKVEGWIFTLQAPSYTPFMKYSDTRILREKMYNAYNSRCNHDNNRNNNRLINEIVNLRLKYANILGFENYSQYALNDRMAKKPENVLDFLNKIHIASKSYAIKEIEEIKSFAAKEGFKDEFMPWDFSYYSEKLKNEKFGFEEEMLKPYFKLENVISGIFNLASTLYGINFVEVNNIPVYHKDVKTYEVFDENGKFLSILYTDLHPRESKQGGAWMTDYRSQSNIYGKMIRPHISLCCNFPKPTESKPSLLTFNDVNTFLHEFGHALHGMFANTVYPSLSGTNVYRDFVELPSQIMENWATENDWLKTFAFHYENGELMPENLIQKLINARNFQSGYFSERQLTFGFLDMAWHSLKNPFNEEISEFEMTNIKQTQYLPIVEGNTISNAFSHIFAGGYAAGYYGYKWAEVLDADAFSLFIEKGIFNKDIAKEFRNNILEKGGTKDPMELYIDFRGKEPSVDALLIRSGLN